MQEGVGMYNLWVSLHPLTGCQLLVKLPLLVFLFSAQQDRCCKRDPMILLLKILTAKQCCLWKKKLICSLLASSVLGVTKGTVPECQEHDLCRKEQGEMLKASCGLHRYVLSTATKSKVQRNSSRGMEKGTLFQEKEKEA